MATAKRPFSRHRGRILYLLTMSAGTRPMISPPMDTSERSTLLNPRLDRQGFVELDLRNVSQLDENLAQLLVLDLLFGQSNVQSGLVQVSLLAKQLTQLLLTNRCHRVNPSPSCNLSRNQLPIYNYRHFHTLSQANYPCRSKPPLSVSAIYSAQPRTSLRPTGTCRPTATLGHGHKDTLPAASLQSHTKSPLGYYNQTLVVVALLQENGIFATCGLSPGASAARTCGIILNNGGKKSFDSPQCCGDNSA